MRRMFLIIAVIQMAAAGFVAQGQARIIASTRFRSYSLADLSAEARNDFLGLDKAIADERTDLLTDQLAALLFATEARSRGITVDQLKSIEIKSQVGDPIEMTAKAYFEAHRTAERKIFDEEATKFLRSLRRQREQERTQTYIGELEKKYGVTRPKDVNASGLKPDDVLASFGDKEITSRQFEEQNAASLWDLRAGIIDEVIVSVENAMFSDLLSVEAKRLGLKTGDQVLTKLTDGSERAKDDLEDKLFAKYTARVQLKRPEFRNSISIDGSPFLGDKNAKVTMVVFSDLQCPHSKRAQPVLEEVAAEFSKRVKLVFKNFPLTPVHPNAFLAAQAALAAQEQGKYFEYVNVLFKNQDTLDDEHLIKYAGDLGLNTKLFSESLASGKFAPKVKNDVEEGERVQVPGTPFVFVNGYRIYSPTRRVLRQVIRQKLSEKPQHKVAGQKNY